MLDGGLSTYTAMHLYTYVPIWLYAYVSTTSTLGGLASVCLVAGFPARWMLSHVVMFIRGGDGALARTRVVAPGCAGDGVSRAGKFHPHPACLHVLTGYMRHPVSLAKVWVRRRMRVGVLFVCLFGASSLYLLCSLFE